MNFDLVIVERCPPPPPKPQAIIYEKYLPPPPPAQRKVIVQRDACSSTVCAPTSCRRIVRQVPQQCQPAQPAVVCTAQTQQKITPGQSQVVQQLVPVFAQRQVSFDSKSISTFFSFRLYILIEFAIKCHICIFSRKIEFQISQTSVNTNEYLINSSTE